jgi:hypothetical protein
MRFGLIFFHFLFRGLNNVEILKIDDDFTAKLNMADYNFSFCDKSKLHSPAWMSPESMYSLI